MKTHGGNPPAKPGFLPLSRHFSSFLFFVTCVTSNFLERTVADEESSVSYTLLDDRYEWYVGQWHRSNGKLLTQILLAHVLCVCMCTCISPSISLSLSLLSGASKFNRAPKFRTRSGFVPRYWRNEKAGSRAWPSRKPKRK